MAILLLEKPQFTGKQHNFPSFSPKNIFKLLPIAIETIAIIEIANPTKYATSDEARISSWWHFVRRIVSPQIVVLTCRTCILCQRLGESGELIWHSSL